MADQSVVPGKKSLQRDVSSRYVKSDGKPKRTAHKSIAFLIFLVVIPFLLCGLGVWIPVHLNNRRLAAFASHLYNYPLPVDTTVLDRQAGLGKVGNGNNCWYRAEQSMQSKLSVKEISDYYSDVRLPRISFGMWSRMYNIPTKTAIEINFRDTPADTEYLYFTLILFDDGPDTTLDFRCH